MCLSDPGTVSGRPIAIGEFTIAPIGIRPPYRVRSCSSTELLTPLALAGDLASVLPTPATVSADWISEAGCSRFREAVVTASSPPASLQVCAAKRNTSGVRPADCGSWLGYLSVVPSRLVTASILLTGTEPDGSTASTVCHDVRPTSVHTHPKTEGSTHAG